MLTLYKDDAEGGYNRHRTNGAVQISFKTQLEDQEEEGGVPYS